MMLLVNYNTGWRLIICFTSFRMPRRPSSSFEVRFYSFVSKGEEASESWRDARRLSCFWVVGWVHPHRYWIAPLNRTSQGRQAIQFLQVAGYLLSISQSLGFVDWGNLFTGDHRNTAARCSLQSPARMAAKARNVLADYQLLLLLSTVHLL